MYKVLVDYFRLAVVGVVGTRGGKPSASSAILILRSCVPILPSDLSRRANELSALEKDSFRFAVLTLAVWRVSAGPMVCDRMGEVTTGGGESVGTGGTMVSGGSTARSGIDEAVDGRFRSLTGDMANGNGAIPGLTASLGAEPLCLNGVDTDEAELDGLGLGRVGL